MAGFNAIRASLRHRSVRALTVATCITWLKPQGKTCAAIVGITDEGAEIMDKYRARPRSTRACSPPRRRSSTTKSPATALCAHGPRNSASMMRSHFSTPLLRKRKPRTKR